MRLLELIAVLAAALALAVWRGVAMYRQTFKRNEL
jgi:hypothetical protein